MIPLIVVEGPHEQFVHAIREVAAAGWEPVPGWTASAGRGATATPGAGRGVMVRTGPVTGPEEAAAAVAAVISGSGVVVHAQASRRVLNALCDDLRHLGALDHRVGDARVVLDDEERRLLDALVDGASVVTAARQLYLSRRTVERRLARLRQRFAAATPVELLAAYRAQAATVPRAPATPPPAS